MCPTVNAGQTAVKITREVTDVAVKAGESAMFECYITGPPDVDVDWLSNGKLIQPALLNCKMHFDGKRSLILSFCFTVCVNNGFSSCMRAWKNCWLLKSLHLFVLDPKSIVLDCFTFQHELFFKDCFVLSYRCRLLLNSVHEDDSGTYTCKLSTAKGKPQTFSCCLERKLENTH